MEQDNNSAFGLCVNYVRDILGKMYVALGWKGASVPFDFSGFSGYWLEITPERINVRQGENVLGAFFPKGTDRLGFESYSEELEWSKNFSSWEVLDDFRRGYLVGTVENIQKARSELRDRINQQLEADIGEQPSRQPSRGIKR